MLTAVLKWSVHTFFPTSLFLFLEGVAVDFSSSLDALDLSARTSSLLWNSGGPMVWRSAVVVYGGGGVLRYDLSVVAFKKNKTKYPFESVAGLQMISR